MVNLDAQISYFIMQVYFKTKHNAYPIVLLPEKIIKNIIIGFDDKTIAKYLNLEEPKGKNVRFPKMPSRSYDVNKSRVKFLWEIASLILTAAFFIAFITGLNDGFIEGLKVFFRIVLFEIIVSALFGFFPAHFEEVSFKKVCNEEKYQQLIDDYNRRMAEVKRMQQEYDAVYRKEIAEYETLIKRNRNYVSNILHRQSLAPSKKAVRVDQTLKRGASEIKFLEQLKNSELSNLVFMDMAPYYLGGNAGYNPDITLICSTTGIHIDIEIDEPYNFSDRKPIHFKESIDDERNIFFLESGWIVIRFTEQQVVKNSQECIKTIASIYEAIINGHKSYNTNLESTDRWTYEDSLIMMKNKVREGYLQSIRIEYID